MKVNKNMTAYTHFTIENFRCFSSKQILKLAAPDQNKMGSGITYIVGANNSGKTTLIESMCIKEGNYINDSDKRLEAPEFQYYDGESLVKNVKFLRRNSNIFTSEGEKGDGFEIISSRRQWNSNAGGQSTSKQIIESSTLSISPRRQGEIPVASILQDIEKDDKKYKEFTEIVRQVLPEFHEWSVGYEGQPYIKYTSQDGISHKSDFLGDGVISIIRILAHLFEKRESGLIIDEPELSLHPLAQKKLIKVIAEYSNIRQIIIATHSAYFISWKYIKNGAVLNRVVKEDETNAHIHTLGKYEDYAKLINGANWQQPFLMDVVSKEIFFQDNVLFVEGQEDVGLLQSLPQFTDTNINFFGYGVRGCDQFEFAFKLAHDLGIKKACILIDSGSKENGIKEKLEKKYDSSIYKIVQWNKADIRDKEAYTSDKKEGYFTVKGELKNLDKLDDFNKKIRDILNHFDQENSIDKGTA